ncbi:MAG: ExbD/TolR family protein [Gammaproteobacteria bacterium]|nr:ExbD/TolR family protein [Gammaproteobacteria bacterium]MDG1951050.1 ExbD/TolR family protein [Gammaproteobacteria bacterium]MDG2118625.1 ExbD/TolR family protein [Gammaproteobacteria bacterium]
MQVIPKKKRKAMSDINVVPYIDVMLVLLIVFMVTAPLLDQGIEVELPEANSEPLNINENIEALVVSLTASGDVFLNIGAFGEERESVTLDTVGTQVSRVVAANPRIQVLIEGDTLANWGAMVKLITVLQEAGVSNPNFITQPVQSD